MTKLVTRMKSYLLQPEVGAGLLFVALAASLLKLWLTEILQRGVEGFIGLLNSPYGVFLAWTAVSFALGAWLAFLLLRRRLSQRALQRVMLVAVVHAVGAIRFYEWGLMLLSVLPLFALAPRLLLSADHD
ncbi:MAG TPA: hypothetical protein VF275_02085 [Gammaproteobacteria bacterium]